MKTKINYSVACVMFLLFVFVENCVSQTWTLQASNTDRDLESISFISPTVGWTVGNQGTVRFTVNGGLNWLPQITPTMENLNTVQFIMQEGWAAGQQGVILHTTNGGLIWMMQNSNTMQDIKSIKFVNPVAGFAVGAQGLILYTSNAGSSWTSQASGTMNDLNSVFFLSAIGYAVGQSGTIIHTTNGGVTWTSQNSGTTRDLRSVFFMGLHGWAVGTNSTILRTVNGGMSWMPDTLNSSDDFNSVFFISDMIGWIAGHNGLLKMSTDGGVSWVTKASPTERDLNSIIFIANDGYAAGQEGTIIKTQSPTGINVISGEVPKGFSLSQNYPNPFNPSTKIRFSVPASSNVRLVVYDMSGRQVEVLVNQFMQAGVFEANWNPVNLSSGIYFYTLKTPSFAETKKMILVK